VRSSPLINLRTTLKEIHDSYSGDTVPCEDIVRAGQDATLLIHEASLADEEWDRAAHRKHSTIGQAVDVARRYVPPPPFYTHSQSLTSLVFRMNAQNVLLTHFSTRYVSVPPRTSEAFPGTLALALDHADLRLGALWKMGAYQRAIERCVDDAGAGAEGAGPEEEEAVAAAAHEARAVEAAEEA
jgi:ribonuclease Z